MEPKTCLQILEYLKTAVIQGGEMVKNADREKLDIREKTGRRDIATHYDEAVQDFLVRSISSFLPQSVFVTEESENDFRNAIEGEYCFFIDPIDGTSNFSTDYHFSCVSVGMASKGELLLGVVYNPYLDELFYASKGNGAYLNETPLKVDPSLPLSKALVGFGTCPYNRELTEETFDFSKAVYLRCNDLRRSGSSALDLCYMAASRLGLFYELSLFSCDYAAAAVIVSEAGGIISTTEGTPFSLQKKSPILAGPKKAYEEFLALRKEFLSNR